MFTPEDILYEDNHLLVVNKHCGDLVQPDPSPRECYPCGQCRQVMVDVERRQGRPMRIVMSGGGTASAVDTAEKLLPFTFKL